jgi:hypothetical protein
MTIVTAFTIASCRRLAVAACLAALTLAGCAPFVGKPGDKSGVEAAGRHLPGSAPAVLPSGGAALARGMASYEDGNFDEAASQLKLSLEQKLSPPEQMLARKHLAFAYCVSGKDRLCADEFKRLLEISASFDLDPAEAGHPIWGPVFRRVKAKKPEPRK